MSHKIHFIVNPAAGQPFPILQTIHQVCEKHDCSWELTLSKKDKPGYALEALERFQAETIVIYGGDGTICTYADYVLKHNKQLGILPGGTANILSNELDITQNIKQACTFICSGKAQAREIDVGRINDKPFLLRVGIGLEAEAVKDAEQRFKNQIGRLAYAFSGFKALLKTKPTQYELTVDGKEYKTEGLSLVVANSGNLGFPGLSLFPKIKIDDGFLDMLLIRAADIQKLHKLSEKHEASIDLLSFFKHWRVKEAVIKHKPAQRVHYDGELLEGEELALKIDPLKLKVLC